MPGENTGAMCASMGIPVDPMPEYWSPEPTAKREPVCRAPEGPMRACPHREANLRTAADWERG